MSQTSPTTATFIWTFEDLQARQAVLAAEPMTSTRKSFVMAFFPYGLLIAAIVYLIAKTRSEQGFPFLAAIQNDPLYFIALLLPILVIWAILTFVPKRNLKRSFLESPDSNKRVTMTFAPDEISMRVDNVYEMKWKWASLIEVRLTPKGFCFFQAPRTGFWIPLRAFESRADIERVSAMAAELAPVFYETVV